MEKPLLLYGMLLLLASCTRYQYATVSSSNTTLNEQHEFVAENDTLLIRYNFLGQNAPVYLYIENKLNVPVYIDWRQSALIVNNKAISYMPSEMPITGDISAVSWHAGNSSLGYTNGTISASASLPKSTDFIPPHAHIKKHPLSVTNRMVKGLPDSSIHRIKMPVSNGGFYNIKRATFSEASSPVRFRSYLTVAVGEAGGRPVAYEHNFYVTELLTTRLSPHQFGYNEQNQGNRYYIKERTGFGKTATGFGVIAGMAVITGATEALVPGSTRCNNCHY